MKNATKLMLMLMLFAFSASTMFGQTVVPGQGKVGGDPNYSPDYVAPPYVPNNSKATLLDEGFEGTWPPTGWTLNTPSGQPFTQTSAYSYTGTYSAFHNDDFVTNVAELITPVLDFSTPAGYQISWAQRGNWTVSYYDVSEILITTDGGGSWTQI